MTSAIRIGLDPREFAQDHEPFDHDIVLGTNETSRASSQQTRLAPIIVDLTGTYSSASDRRSTSPDASQLQGCSSLIGPRRCLAAKTVPRDRVGEELSHHSTIVAVETLATHPSVSEIIAVSGRDEISLLQKDIGLGDQSIPYDELCMPDQPARTTTSRHAKLRQRDRAAFRGTRCAR